MMKVVDDSEIMVRHVRTTIHYVPPCLKTYQQEVWRLISNFQDFNIISVPRMYNIFADALKNEDAKMLSLRDGFTIEILYKPSILDNITNLHIFMMTKKYCTLWLTLMYSKRQ